MANTIRQIQVRNQVLNPAEAEVWITVTPEFPNAGAEIRGRLMGPHCHFASTVEVAYPLRPLGRPPESLPPLTMRVLIPEPSLWDPVSPFLYQGPVELWSEGQRCDSVPIRHGLRTVGWAARGVLVNGQVLALRGVFCQQLSEAEALRLRLAGFNTLFVPVHGGTLALWEVADRLGFLVLGQVTRTAEALPHARALMDHPSCLGWVLEAAIEGEDLTTTVELLNQGKSRPWIGIEVDQRPAAIPPGIHFILGQESQGDSLASLKVPIVLRGQGSATRALAGNHESPSLGIAGWIDDAEAG